MVLYYQNYFAFNIIFIDGACILFWFVVFGKLLSILVSYSFMVFFFLKLLADFFTDLEYDNLTIKQNISVNGLLFPNYFFPSSSTNLKMGSGLVDLG